MLHTHGLHYLCSCVIENYWLRQVEFWACCFFLENLTGDCFVTNAFCTLCIFFHDEKILLEAGGILSLCNYSWKLDCRLLCTNGVHCLFTLLMRNSYLRQLEFRACSKNVRHEWCLLSVFLRDGKFLPKAGGNLSLWNFSWKFDQRLLCCAHILYVVCFLSCWKILARGW